jgi:type I restriction enzyme S subunit
MTTTNTKIPVLRFPGFEGEWEEKRLGDITTWASGGTPRKDREDYWNGNIPWISASSMRGNEFIDSDLKISVEGLKKGSKLAIKGSILILVRGSMLYNIIPVGIAGRDVAFNQDVKSIVVKEGNHIRYILYWLIASENKLLNIVTGTGIGAGKLDLQDLKDLTIHIPKIQEQQKIAAFLTAVDTRIQQLTRQKALLEQYKRGAMQQIFSQQIRFKDDQGGEFPAWEEGTLSKIASFSKGKGISKADIEDNGARACITYGELYTYYGEIIDEVRSRTNLNPDTLIFSEINDVIIPASGETHIDIATASCVLKSGVALGGDLNIIKSKSNGVFLSYYLNNAKRNHIARLAQGSSVVHLYSSQLKLLKLLLPSLPEQQKIAAFLSAIDQKIEIAGRQLGGVRAFKRGLLQGMFV